MKKVFGFVIVLMLGMLVACGSDAEKEEEGQTDELAMLDVEFIVPETAEPGEQITLEAIVTYGEAYVEDADEVMFEYWLKGHEDDSAKVEGVHQENGKYTADVTFEEDGIYEMYAHTTAEGLHTMPLTSITIGEGGEAEHDEGHGDDHEHHNHGEHAEGFNLHFMKPDKVAVNEETELVVHLQIDGDALDDADVRYEIVPEGEEEDTVWIDAEETAAGEYAGVHSFTEAAAYSIVIHVEDDSGLHEHDAYTIEVEN